MVCLDKRKVLNPNAEEDISLGSQRHCQAVSLSLGPSDKVCKHVQGMPKHSNQINTERASQVSVGIQSLQTLH